MRPQTAKAGPSLEDVAARYAVAITPAMAALIDPGDPNDPIAAQFTPDVRELDALPHERADPIGDDAHAAASCLVHRYPDRVLLKLVNVCPVYCRFCFRRETVGQPTAVSAAVLEDALRYIRADANIWEVILTGGDPFMVSPRRAAHLTQELAAIDHVKIVRWHTRVPVVAPERTTAEFAQALRAEGVTTYVVLHANHPRELTPHARTAIARIIDAGIPMLSQSVLLRGVNDDAETLESLMRTFVELRIKPYYLHHGDLAPGTSHFRTTIERGQALVQTLHDAASGLCQPHYVIDSPGGHGKAPLAPPSARRTQDGWLLRGRDGAWRRYEDPQ
ncbi:MAG: lysine-2,3-aminomutase-like protein [Alphaproteobacteria bacterium]|nr:lysine-2,3-aminomutase-like protein [Alphaproteobacteria bacterium]